VGRDEERKVVEGGVEVEEDRCDLEGDGVMIE
jgi:hypothetical protein